MAWVNDRFGFIHVPRTGGTSLAEVLRQNEWERIGHEHSPIFHMERAGRQWFSIMRDRESWLHSLWRASNHPLHYDYPETSSFEYYKGYFEARNKVETMPVYSDLYLYPEQYVDEGVRCFDFLDWDGIFNFIGIPKPENMPHIHNSIL